MTTRDGAYRFAVAGKPITQGSMSVFRGRVVHQKSRELTAWRNAINQMCRGTMEPLEGPVSVDVVFRLQPPRGAPRDLPHVRPDVDKLARAALDGLTGAAFADDSQVVRLTATKEYGPPGALFIIEGITKHETTDVQGVLRGMD